MTQKNDNIDWGIIDTTIVNIRVRMVSTSVWLPLNDIVKILHLIKNGE